MVMTDSDLISSYRQAADKPGQIKILSQLNAVSLAVMYEKLASLGLDVGELPSPKPKKKPVFPFDEEVAWTLVQSGAKDKEIVQQLGTTLSAFRRWKESRNLINRGQGKPAPVIRSEKQPALFSRYADAVSRLAEAFPTAVLAKPTSGLFLEISLQFENGGKLTVYVQ